MTSSNVTLCSATKLGEQLIKQSSLTWVIVRLDGKDYVVDTITEGHDGVIGNNVILNIVPISKVL
jgi:hypothetical protein